VETRRVAGVRANLLKPALLAHGGAGIPACPISADENVRATSGRILSRGVVLVYSHNFALYLDEAARDAELRRLVAERFVVVGHFSWCPEDNPETVAQALELKRRGLLHLAMQRDAAGLFRRQGFAGHEIIPLSVGDLIDPEVFRPTGATKDIDVVSLSRLRRWKRLEILLGALVEIRRKTGRAPRCLILDSARGQGPDAEYAREIAERIRRDGLAGAVEITTVPDKEVPAVLSRARVSAVCSAVEGECRAITESLFCDVPVIAMREMRGGGIKYLTEECGVLTTPEGFAADLVGLIERSAECRPRKYISAITGAEVAWPRVEAAVRRYFETEGLPFAGEMVRPDYMKLLKTGTETLTAAGLRGWTRNM